MRNRLTLLLVLAVGPVLSTGCQKYIELTNVSDRIWMVTTDQTEVFRCWDLKNQTGKLIAVCRRAEMLGKNEGSKNADLAESTAATPHPDSTEIGPTSSLPASAGPPTASRPTNPPR